MDARTRHGLRHSGAAGSVRGRRVLVIGGRGFVGRAVVDRCRADGDHVVVAGRRPVADPPHGDSGPPALRIDLAESSPSAVAGLLDELAPDVVVNTVGSIWGRTDEQMWSAATLPTVNLLEALRLARATPMLIHLGSVLEYGQVPPGTTVGPNTTPRPETAYGRAKLAATETVMEAHRRGEVDACVLRISNVCGPGMPSISLLGQVTEALLQARHSDTPAQIRLRPLNAHRDYVDVRDVADAVRMAACRRHAGSTVDIGSGTAVSVRDLVELLIEVSGVPARVIEIGPPSSAADWMQVDRTSSRVRLGWTPSRSLRTSVEDHWRSSRAAVTVHA